MKQSLSQLKKNLREAYLGSEKEIFSNFFKDSFKLKKDWDSDPVVIWEGEISDPNLKRKYKVEIHYDVNYPFHRPKVYPLDKKIKNNRHQNPNKLNNSLPGDICIFQDSFSDWVVGTNCREIIRRAIKWFKKFEDHTLIYELAPPEIERYYPNEDIILSPEILLPETLLSIKGKRRGEFIWLPTKSGKFAFIATYEKDSDVKERCDEVNELISISFPQEKVNIEKMLLGRWFLLEQEPFDPLPRSLTDLLKLISQSVPNIDLKTITTEISTNPLHFLAICYKTRLGSIHWIVYDFYFKSPPKSKIGQILGFRKQSAYTRILYTNNFSRLKIFFSHHLTKEAIFRRVSNYPLEKLNNSKVLVLGAGTIGSRVIDLLAKSGVGKIYIADNDVLEIGNISRHILPLSDIGLPKAGSLKNYLLQRNPFLNIDVYDKDITNSKATNWLTRVIQEVDLVISCIGNDATESWINYSTTLHSKPTLYCRVYAHATIGEIFLSKPNQICFNCLSELLSEDTTIPRPPKLDFEDMVMFDDADCGASFIPGSASDIDLISLHCTRIAIDFLSSKTIQNSYWLIRGREFDVENNWDIDERLRQPYSVLGLSPIPRKECSVCGFKPSN